MATPGNQFGFDISLQMAMSDHGCINYMKIEMIIILLCMILEIITL